MFLEEVIDDIKSIFRVINHNIISKKRLSETALIRPTERQIERLTERQTDRYSSVVVSDCAVAQHSQTQPPKNNNTH